ncbi:MAG: 2-dehydro-3-deoxygalactonokinase [Pseudomonadota bacterium]|nr:2-dehydro-3-deoxygalactonokinase [Pseudomonadota bacterium]
MAGLIGLDWGTSSLRAYWLEEGGIRQSRSRPWGIRQLPAGGFEAALAEICADWPLLPRLACGMVGSRNGWLEVPYLDLPAAPARLGASLQSVRAADGRELHIVPGLRNPQGPDVMRGEETQLVGAIVMHPSLGAASTVILPGTHSKWVSIREGAVVDFCTMMTGELFSVLRQHSILGAGIGEASDDAAAFARGVVTARDSGAAGALSRLFSARALMLDGELTPSAVPDYLSGLLLGEELRSCLATGRFARDQAIHLIGDNALCARYRAAAAHFDLELTEPLTDAAAYGLWHVASHAGLVPAVTTSKEAYPC